MPHDWHRCWPRRHHHLLRDEPRAGERRLWHAVGAGGPKGARGAGRGWSVVAQGSVPQGHVGTTGGSANLQREGAEGRRVACAQAWALGREHEGLWAPTDRCGQPLVRETIGRGAGLAMRGPACEERRAGQATPLLTCSDASHGRCFQWEMRWPGGGDTSAGGSTATGHHGKQQSRSPGWVGQDGPESITGHPCNNKG